MRKTCSLIVTVLFLLAPLAAGTIRVTSPNGGETLTLGGSPFPITWTTTGISQNVKIVLIYPGGGRVGFIAEGLAPGSSPYSWTVGEMGRSAAPAGEYRIRVITMDGETQDNSDGNFTIAAGSSTPPASTLRIIHPSAGENFCLNKENEITWDPGNTAGQPVCIRLRQPDRPMRIIAASTENSGRFNWTPEAGTPGGTSIIEFISLSSGRNLGISDSFHLATCIISIVPLDSVTTCMTVSGPAAGAHLPVGQYAEIRWNTAAAGGGNIVQLTAIRQADNFEIAIRGGVGNAPGDHTYSWLIDRGRFINHTGQYRIRLNSNSGATAQSPVFEVTAYIDETATPQQDLILSIDPSSIEFTRLIGDADPHNFIFRLRATLRMMNASHRPAGGPFPVIREVKCNWRVQLERNGVWETMDPADASDDSRFNGSQPFWVGPFYSGAWTTQHITIDFHVWHYTRLRRRILFQLDPDQEINDPVRSNNITYSTGFTPPAAD